MPRTIAVSLNVAADPALEPAFDHERLEVYRLALALDGQLHVALPRRGMRALRDQLERASVSVVAASRPLAAVLLPPFRLRRWRVPC